MLIQFVFLLLCSLHINAKVMLSMYSDQSIQFYECVKQQGFSSIILQVDSDLYGPKQSNIQNIFNARKAGLEVQFGYVPCRSHNIINQIQLLIKKIGKENFQRIWLGPQQSHPGCSWTEHKPEDNCQYLTSFIMQIKAYGIGDGIGTSRASWPTVFGSVQGCANVNTTPLWWFPIEDENDGIPSFDKYHQIGGWKYPFMKAYNTFEICGGLGVISYLP